MHLPSEKGDRGKDPSQGARASFAAFYGALRRQTEQHCPKDGFYVVENHVRFEGAPTT